MKSNHSKFLCSSSWIRIIKGYIQQHGVFLFVLCIATFLIYGPRIIELGFYWDDLPNTFFEANGGAGDVFRTVATGRLAMAFLYYFPYRFLGENPLYWQIYAIISRFVLIFCIYLFLTSISSKRRVDFQKITLLMLVYPGFTQQWISKIYPQIFFVFSLEFLALILFIRGYQKKKGGTCLLVLSALLSLFCLNASEYIFGLEFMRLVLIFILESENNPGQKFMEVLRITFLKWFPFLIMLIGFMVYRSFWSNSNLYSVSTIELLFTHPFQTLCDWFVYNGKMLFTGIIGVWIPIFTSFQKRIFSFTDFGILFSLVLLISILLNWQKGRKGESPASDGINDHWPKTALLLSISSLLFASIPFWAAGLLPSTTFPNDRFFLSFMFGASILLYLFLIFFSRWRIFQNTFFTMLFCFSAFLQFNLADSFVEDWKSFTALIQQLSWRAPSFAENSFLITDEFPLKYYSDNSLTGAINWLYTHREDDYRLPIMLNYSTIRLGKSLKSLEANSPIHQNYLLYQFDGTTDEMVVLSYDGSSCLLAFDPRIDPYNPQLSPEMKKVSAISNLGQIKNYFQQNDLFFLLGDDHTNLCFYFQKASLAMQNRDWVMAASLADSAFELGLNVNNPREAVPFIAGYAFTSKWERATNLTLSASSLDKRYSPMMCKLWNIIDINTKGSPQKDYAVGLIYNHFSCDTSDFQ